MDDEEVGGDGEEEGGMALGSCRLPISSSPFAAAADPCHSIR